MSVLVSERRESKFEAITCSIELHDILIDLMQRNFGVKNIDNWVRTRYAYGRNNNEDFQHYRYLMTNFKNRVDNIASSLTNNLRAANSTYPTTIREYEKRRDYQNNALVNCEQLIKELQRIINVFDVDINIYAPYILIIDKEINLIKKWRQKDNRMKSYLQGNI